MVLVMMMVMMLMVVVAAEIILSTNIWFHIPHLIVIIKPPSYGMDNIFIPIFQIACGHLAKDGRVGMASRAGLTLERSAL